MATVFFVSMVPMIYFFIQHKVHRVPGAYTRYSFFEWGLIIFDIMFDSAAELELEAANLEIGVGTISEGAGANDIVTVGHFSVAAKSTTVKTPATMAISSQKDHAVSPSPAPATVVHRLSLVKHFVSDMYLSYIYWSIYTSLTPTLFYFSVWELGIAGHELSLLSTLSPILLGIPPFAEWCPYKLESPLHRLFVVAFATSVVNIGAAVDWTGPDASYQTIVAGLGFLLSSISKHANHSNNPVWPIVHEQSGGYNKTGIVLAIIAILDYATRPASNVLTSSTDKAEPIHKAPGGSWLRESISLGSLMFTLHCLLADSSTLIAWSWIGYPVKGPVPHLHGSITHVAQALGLLLPLLLTTPSSAGLDVFLHPLWFAYGCGSAYIMYAYKDWLGYAGGANLAVFLMSVFPAIVHRAASTGRIARTFGLAWLIVCVFIVTNVFTVAYAFVPGGEYFREHTDLVLTAQMAALGLAFRWPGLKGQTRLGTTALSKRARVATGSALAALTVVSLLVSLYRWPSKVIQPHRPGPRIVRTGIWTVHFGIDNEGKDSQRRMRDLIRDMELDVVGLLETDLHRTVFGNRDLTRVMADELGFYVDIGPGPNQHTWGAVLLSKFPILSSTHHLLPSPHGELAPAIEAVLDMYGTNVTVLVAHNGQEETPLDRELQAGELARIMSSSYPQPVIFLGYVVTKPLALRPAPYEIMVADGRVLDIDEEDWDRWCEYIFYRGLYRTAYARVSRSTITDTELQIGQFQLPRHGFGVTDDSREARYMRSWKEDLPPDHWFPMEYYPELGGKGGHFYHVFDTPLYYKLPEGALL
ncbi:hypothetical protein EVJ58_g6408 [Rhodofomes roseus]|uniref:Uncharacterized protein n=1 Tax=Rhodofomes roseus TaxID=34475 RepID=A0A4Y9YAI0_9APHY|nr:hypothetical protein EVJ58_g6408 [Rhodofomes roseus]